MKRKVVLVLTAAFWMVLHFAAQDQERPIERVRKQFAEDLDQFQKQIRSFKVDFTAFRQGDLEQEDLQVAFAKLRFDFKRSEFLLDYLQPQDVKDHLNGAPLPKTERNAPRLVILEPKGLQTMEERVYDPKLKEQSDGFMQLIKELEYQFRISAAFAKRAQLTDRQVFEALRLGLVRVLSMGITGFDTPASDLAIEETAVTWRAFARTLQPYLEICEDAALVDEIRRKMQGAQAQLNDQSNFATFDRLRFIRNYLEPLYGLLLDLHLHLNYETAEEVYRGQLAFNYRSRSIFSEDFFNLAYFTGLEPNENIKAKAHLGRYLFFDPVLSKNFQRSCASCHKPDKAFADGLPQSLALDGKAHLDRNSPGLFNVLYAEKFFYDLRADRMETQMEHVIFSAQEFGSNSRKSLGD